MFTYFSGLPQYNYIYLYVLEIIYFFVELFIFVSLHNDICIPSFISNLY